MVFMHVFKGFLVLLAFVSCGISLLGGKLPLPRAAARRRRKV